MCVCSLPNYFSSEIVPVQTKTALITTDELPSKARPEKIPLLKPAFSPDGTVTAANASGISDGAAAHILMNSETAQKLNINPIAKIIGHATHSQEPSQFTTAPIGAIEKLVTKINWKSSDVDLFEINEAFACVSMAAIQTLKLDPTRLYVTVWGGDEKINRDDVAIESWKKAFKKYNIEAEFSEDISTIPDSIEAGLKHTKRIFPYGRKKNWWQRGEAVGELVP